MADVQWGMVVDIDKCTGCQVLRCRLPIRE